MKKLYFLFFTLFSFQMAHAQSRITVSGYITEKGSQEQLIGVNIYVPNSSIGTSSNTYGFYSLSLPARDSLTLIFSYVGYGRIERTISFLKNQELNIQLIPANQLAEVVVSAKKQEERISENVQMSQIEVPIQQIKKIPAFLGEKDVLKVLQLMPGVQKGSEGQSGIYVRGGGPDQNLIILDDANVYNASHLFGFFSTFNGDALKSVELTKGGFPARYGGRLSSVIELNMKEGNKEKLHGEGGIGLISSRLTLEAPIVKGKSSFLVSGRRTYIDVLAKPVIAAAQKGETEQARPGYYFYDLNAKLNYDFGKKNKLYLSGYFGQDRFSVTNTSPADKINAGIDWGNATSTLRWNHLFSEKLFANTSLIFSKFNFKIHADEEVTTSSSTQKFQLNYNSSIRDVGVKIDFDYFPNPKNSIKFGMLTTLHRFSPSAVAIKDGVSNLNFERKQEIINTIESGIYAENLWNPMPALKLNVGLRVSYFNSENKSYVRPEPRLSAAYRLSTDWAFKASYARMNQYVHLLSNTGLGLPTDLWVPTTNRIAPQQSEQVAAGFAKDFSNPQLTLSIEGYSKKMSNIISYKEGASFLNLDGQNAQAISWQDNITAGRGWSYGIEFLLQKKVGKFSGWAGYTWSRTEWQFDELNFGKKFFPKYDRRHDIGLVGIYEINKRITFSSTWVFGTGNALTMPQSKYYAWQDGARYSSTPSLLLLGSPIRVTEYGEKNSFRAEPYHRLDIALQFHKQKKRHERTWEIGCYNVYNRKNPFFYDIAYKSSSATSDAKYVLNRYALFPIIPSVSYNFKF